MSEPRPTSDDDPPSAKWGRWTAPAAILAIPFWRRQHDAFYEPESGPRSCNGVLATVLLRLASQDWLLFLYLVALLALVIVGDGPRRSRALLGLGGILAAYVTILWRVRRPSAPCSMGVALLYRLGILVALLGSFLELHWILPTASGRAVDAALHAIDLRVFGIEPAEAWDRFVRPSTTEWFSFFYYGYFFLVAVHVLPALFFGRSERFLTTFGFGFLWLYCVGHVVYTFVPAYGPYAHLKFQHALEGPVWWNLVQSTVASVDEKARTDVFPSLHTAGPAFLTLYSFLHRRERPFTYTWLPLAFCASQIIIATMFLRWHYLIDICAGLLLAVSGVVAGRLALAWDEARVQAGGQSSWPAFSGRA